MTDDYDRFGPYQIHECLGAGGMATVHRASIHVADGVRRDVALKRLLPQLADDKLFVEDFIREAKLVAGLDHPNIVKILELGCVGRTYFIAMELVQGVPLLALMKGALGHRRPVPIGVVLALVAELCEALDYASNGTDAFGEPLRIVHRDLSPSNLLITDVGHLKVIDFGVAKAVAGTRFQTMSGLVKGKLGYMAVEALTGRPVDTRADLFSAGVVAWEMLCAQRLFKGRSEDEIIEAVRAETIARPSTHNSLCPRELDAVVMRALARSIDDRWQTAAELRHAIEEVRRYYRDQTSPREVIAWMRASVPERSATVRGGPDRMTTADVVDRIDEPQRQGTDRDAPRLSSARKPRPIEAASSVSIEDPSKQITIESIDELRVESIEDAPRTLELEDAARTFDAMDAVTLDRAARFEDSKQLDVFEERTVEGVAALDEFAAPTTAEATRYEDED